MTYGVMVVDDDAMMRMNLRMIIDWESEGFLLLGEAENGEKAKLLMQEQNPDIVITDMKMPVLDGVGLIRALRELPNPPQVIALSSYDDYTLVREAMRLGAVDYLLKTDLTADKLLQVLRPLRKDTSVRRQTVKVDALRANLVKNMISRFFLSDDDLTSQLQQAAVSFHGDGVWCLVIKADIEHMESEEEYHTICLSLINIAEEIARDYLDAFCAEGFTGEFYLLGSFRETEPQAQQRVRSMAERLAKMLEQYLDLMVSIGISSGAQTVQGLFHACRQARLAARQAALLEQTVALPEQVQEIGPDGLTQQYRVLRLLPQLDQALSIGDMEQIHIVLDTFRIELCSLRVPIAARRQITAELLVNLRESLKRYDWEKYVPAVTAQQQFEELAHIRNTNELMDWLEVLEATLCDGLTEATKNGHSAEVTQVQQYIDMHFAEELVLPQLAKQLNITPGYLSTRMKRELGMTFSEYVLHVRMEHAKQLLEQGKLHIYEVAAQVGYSNPYYFNTLFKREFGCSPGQYSRKRMQKGELT